MRKTLKIATGALLALAITLPWVSAELFRARIQYALEQSLGRRVEIGAMHFTLLPGVLPGPGFTLDQVLIHEDRRAGIEPFAYVESLGASVRLWSLFSRRLEFSRLNLDDATVNIVKSAEGPWNVQFLLAAASGNPGSRPSVRMRGGRVNFKFGDTKSVFYLNNADLDVVSSADGSYQLGFGGVPSRTDRTAQEGGRLFVRGTSSAAHRLNFTVELERGEIEETLRWIIPGGSGVHGTIKLTAELRGAPSRLEVTGRLEFGDVHRWDLLPAQGSGWQMAYRGTLDLNGEQLELISAPVAGTTAIDASPLTLRLHASHWLSSPTWDAAAELRQVPLDTLLKIARHMGASIPERMTAAGSVAGWLSYGRAQSPAGRLELGQATLTPLGGIPARAPSKAVIVVANGAAKLEKTVLRAGEAESAEVEARYSLSDPLDLRITTRGLDLALMRSFALADIPGFRETTGGSWRGAVRYHRGAWSGDFELRKASLPVDGMGEPVQIDSAAVSLNGPRFAVTKIRARAGNVRFTGAYRQDSTAPRPHRFELAIAEANAADLQKLLAPTMQRTSGFLSRTLRLGATPKLPEWLEARRAEGTIAVDSLAVGDSQVRDLSGRLLWEGTSVRLTNLKAKVDAGTLAGDLDAGLINRLPLVHFAGKLDDFPYRGGAMSLEGTLDAGGDVDDFASSLRYEGTFRGRTISWGPDAEFRTATGNFEARGFGPRAKWKLANLEVNRGGELLTGTGSIESDGPPQLDLARARATPPKLR